LKHSKVLVFQARYFFSYWCFDNI